MPDILYRGWSLQLADLEPATIDAAVKMIDALLDAPAAPATGDAEPHETTDEVSA